jgi:hypothetical protein
MVGELLDLGFNLFSFANNHTADFGGKGIRDMAPATMACISVNTLRPAASGRPAHRYQTWR